MPRKRNILVVDDERTIREVVRRYLELEGFMVTEAETGPEALSILQASQPDLIVLDIMLPGVDGFAITRRLRSASDHNPLSAEGGIPIILLSARGNEVDRVAGLELGADDYVTKPFSPRELVARVKAVLRRASPPESESESPLESAGLRMDPRSRTVHVNRQSGLIDGEGIRPALVLAAASASSIQTGATAAAGMGLRIRWLREHGDGACPPLAGEAGGGPEQADTTCRRSGASAINLRVRLRKRASDGYGELESAAS